MSERALLVGWPGAVGTDLGERLLQRGLAVEAIAATPAGVQAPPWWLARTDPLREARERLQQGEPSPTSLVLFPRQVKSGVAPDQAAGMGAVATAARHAGIRRIVLWGSAGGYAAGARAPVAESNPLEESSPEARLEAALGESDGPGVAAFRFRAAAVVGTSADWVSRAVKRRVLPAWPGATLQALHHSDAVAVLAQSLSSSHPGTYNVAADGLLLWSHAVRALGLTPVRCPRAVGLRWLATALACPELLAQLRCGAILDTARLKTHFGYRPAVAAREGLAAARDAARRALR